MQLIQWCAQANLPLHILLTKSDKLKRGAASASLQTVKTYLKTISPENSVQLFSALKRTGTDNLILVLDKWLGINQNGD
jgi:GTP-binding protein